MKTIVKRILKTRFPTVANKFTKSRILNIDLVYLQGTSLVICGWLADREKSVEEKSLLFNGFEIAQMSFERGDVVGALGLSSASYCKGFLAVISNIKGDVNTVLIQSGEFQYHLSKQRFRSVSTISDLLSHVPMDREKALQFLKQEGLDTDKVSDNSTLITRNLDKDVQRIKQILDAQNVHDADFFEQLDHNVLQSLHKIWRQRLDRYKSSSMDSFGSELQKPKLSLIIPIYGRYDFIQHQISAFSADSTMTNVEVIFVLDDPQLEREVKITAHGVFKIFDYPFKVVYSDKNRGFAGANNLGVTYATSSMLLLLNSDILPSKHGWVDDLLSQYSSIDECGILGCTLLYEDMTVQHAGMEFRKDSHYPGIWMNHHPFKGVPAELLSFDETFEVPITTGACMLIEKSLFEEVGGFDPMYILGDFEDSDLCLKVIDKGLSIHCSSTVRLFHLERLSQNLVDQGDWKFKLTLANGVYQCQKWQDLIAEKVKCMK